MSKPITLQSPRYDVIIGDPENETTWQRLEVQTITPDLIRAEGLFVRHKWGDPSKQGMRVALVSIWAALVRTNQIDGSLEAFEDQVIEFTPNETDEVGPTQPALEAD